LLFALVLVLAWNSSLGLHKSITQNRNSKTAVNKIYKETNDKVKETSEAQNAKAKNDLIYEMKSFKTSSQAERE